MTPQEAAAKWNAATPDPPYDKAQFDADTVAVLTPADATAYLLSIVNHAYRLQASVWSAPGDSPIAVAYQQLDPLTEQFNPKFDLPVPAPAPDAPAPTHPFDALPTGTVITKTNEGFGIAKPGQPFVTHVGGFDAWVTREWNALKHLLHL